MRLGIILLAVVAVIAVIVSIPVFSYIGAYNLGNRYETKIQGQYQKNQNAMSTFSNSVVESAQVPKQYSDDLSKVITAGMQGRYGDKGSTAMIQAITEAYPGQLDSKLYTRIQDQIEAGRRNFADEQNILISMVAAYHGDLGSFWTGTWLRIAGYPRADFDFKKYDPVVSGYAQDTFSSGVDKGLQVFPTPAPATK